MKKLLIIFAIVILVRPVLGACHAVSPNGSGSKTGADWNDAYANLPSTLVRGDIYYLADGNYGNNLNVTTAASGTTTITIKKAQSYDYGRSSDGCSNNISAGWNSSTMGASQAAWYSPACTSGCSNSIVNLGSGGYIIINGNTKSAPPTVGCGGVQANPPAAMTDGPPTPSDCGILISDYTCKGTGTNYCDTSGGEIRGGGAGDEFIGVEWFGQGLNSNGNNNSEPYFWFANGGVLTNVIISQSYIHNMGTTAFTVVSGGWNGGSFDHNYAWGEFDGSVNHGESVQLQGSNGQTTPDNIDNNIWRDQQTNGDVVATDTSGHSQTVNIWNNVDFCSTGGTSTTCRHNDGVIGCFGNSVCVNYLVYNNTFSFPSNCGWNVSSGASTMTVENNLWYDCDSVGMTNGNGGGSTTVDYNSYLNSGRSAVGSHDISVASGAANPFVNLANGDLQLSKESSNYNNRLSLSSPYKADLYGNPFTDDRGASQFSTTGASKPITISGNFTFNSGTYQ